MHAFGSDEFVAEISNATVSGLVDVRTLDWSDELFEALDSSNHYACTKVGHGIWVEFHREIKTL